MGKIIVGILVIGVISFFTFRGGDKEVVDKEEETKERKTASLGKPETKEKETLIEKEKKEEEKEKVPKLSKEKVAEIKELIQKGKDEGRCERTIEPSFPIKTVWHLCSVSTSGISNQQDRLDFEHHLGQIAR